MKTSLKTGLSFGITSGIITTLGLIVGLNAGTNSQAVVMGGILTIAVADSFSDALGIHISEESDKKKSHKQVWESTIATLFAKILFTLTFLVPVLFLELKTAILVSVAWGFLVITILSYKIARQNNQKPLKSIAEHLLTTTFVIIATNYIGDLIKSAFS